MSSSPAISVRHISKRYQLGKAEKATLMGEAIVNRLKNPFKKKEYTEFMALNDVSFDIMKGDVVGVISRNGAGKSTLLKVLSRITQPTSGEILLYGRTGSLLEVGTGFHPELTGRENVFLNGTILGMSRTEIKREFDAIVDFAEVEQFLETPVKRYSSGMYVRLAFAVAAFLNPEILIVDEVLAVGDAEFQKKCLGKMHDVADQGRTVLFVSHNMAAVQNLCNRGIVLQSGRLIYDGNIETAIQHYRLQANRSEEEANGVYDLTKRDLRSGQSHIIEHLEIRDFQGRLTDRIPMGTPLSMKIDVNGLGRHHGSSLAVNFLTETGQRVSTVNTLMLPLQGRIIEGRSELTLQIDSLPLVPGIYGLEITVWHPNQGRLDAVEGQISLEIEDRDIYGTGVSVTSQDGVAFATGSWKSHHQ
jgi:lipopolysaccharide transport system ATP-binding protein